MKRHLRTIGAFAATLVIAGALAGPAAWAGGEPGDPTDPKAKCNSGRGNLSETTPANDCDPGNSGGHNNGGD